MRTKMTLIRIVLLAAMTLLLVASSIAARSPVQSSDTATSYSPVLRLQRGVFDPLRSQPDLPAALAVNGFADVGRAQTVVQFQRPIQPGWRPSLEALGVQVLDYVPDFAYLVLADGAQREALGKLPAVRYVGPWQPAYKIATSLDASLKVEAAGEPLTLIVRTVPGADAESFHQALRDLGITPLQHSPNAEWGDLWRVQMFPGQIVQLAQRSEVIWIEPFQKRQLSNDVGRSIMKVTAVQAAFQSQGTLLYGGGQIVGVADTGLDLGSTTDVHADFAGRVIKTYALGRQGDGSDPDGHGTHVAGSVLGSGARFGSNPSAHSYANSFAGAAPEARLVFQALQDSQGGLGGIPDDLNQLFTPPYDDGARVHTNSWGGRTGGTQENPEYGGYDTQSQTADQFLWNHQDVAILFSAGNNGTDKLEPLGLVDPDSIGSPGTAKNVITVGASENVRASGGYNPGGSCTSWGDCWPNDFGQPPIKDDLPSNNANGMAAFSSRGPTDDGRIKPELVAPGTNIISVRSRQPQAGTGWGVYNEHYLYMGGTSMATPLTAGMMAVVRQFWTDVVRTTPSGALLKATLLNGAVNMSPGQYGTGNTQEIPGARPNFVIGWGRADLAGSLAAYPGGKIVFDDNITGLNTDGQVTYRVTITGTSTTAANSVTDLRTGRTVSTAHIVDRPARMGPAAANGQLIVNGDFEAGNLSGWAIFGEPYVTSSTSASGSYSAVLTGGDNQANEIGQRLTIPANTTSATLKFYANISGDESSSGVDRLIFALYDVNTGEELLRLATLDGAEHQTTGWAYFNVPLSSEDVAEIKGTQVDFFISGRTDFADTTYFLVDDVTFTTAGYGEPTRTPTPPSVTPTPTRTPTPPSVTPTPTRTPTPPSVTPTPTPTLPPSGEGKPFRVTLSWYDYPGNPAANGRLVNDLDLEVIAPDGARYYGNGASAGNPDRVNPNESVEIKDARPGVYQVIVRGYNVPNGPQPYAIVMAGAGLTSSSDGSKIKVYLPIIFRNW